MERKVSIFLDMCTKLQSWEMLSFEKRKLHLCLFPHLIWTKTIDILQMGVKTWSVTAKCASHCNGVGVETTYESSPNVFAKLSKALRFSFNKVSAYLHIRNCELRQFKWIVKSFSLQLSCISDYPDSDGSEQGWWVLRKTKTKSFLNSVLSANSI